MEPLKTTYLKDYKPSPYTINEVDLDFRLNSKKTEVSSLLKVQRNPNFTSFGDVFDPETSLILQGEDLELLELSLDGENLTEEEYRFVEGGLEIFAPVVEGTEKKAFPEVFILFSKVRIFPDQNSRLSGLYVSGETLCTQCEAEGFRRITYFLDRPDVLASYRVRLQANKEEYPVLLSNGNQIEEPESTRASTQLSEDSGDYSVLWEDPYPKPSYLFALVAGKFDLVEERLKTQERDVDLRIYVEPGKKGRAYWALESLKNSMLWDEKRFDLSYDLNLFNIVAVSDFNAGAMENKSLNIFNDRYILADEKTATDLDYEQIESVVAHEYFHNWTGNRVTCRDWFQLTLKEGLTVFRDQEFTSDHRDRDVKRIEDVVRLRGAQFTEDSSPLAHPIRPEKFIEIENFYTATVYEKGAEVIRMIHTLLGEELFQEGMKLYFQRHDGQAVTCEDFVKAMQDAFEADKSSDKVGKNTKKIDFKQFFNWYGQAGTPVISVTSNYDPDLKQLRICFEQEAPKTQESAPLLMPFSFGLLGEEGQEYPLKTLEGEILEHPFILKEEKTEILLSVPERPTLSLNRAFSAPVLVKSDLSHQDLAHLFLHDRDSFARWEAGQQLATNIILSRVKGEKAESNGFEKAFERILEDETLGAAYKNCLLTVPSRGYVAERLDVVDVEALEREYTVFQNHLAERFEMSFLSLYEKITQDLVLETGKSGYTPDPLSVAKRSLKNKALLYLCRLEKYTSLAFKQSEESQNMTDRWAGLVGLNFFETPEREAALTRFYTDFKGDASVLNKWFTVQASAAFPSTLGHVRALLKHPEFDLKNPNKVYSLLGGFMRNLPVFHQATGEGYDLVMDFFLELEEKNPKVTSRLIQFFADWKRYDAGRQKKMEQALVRMRDKKNLSKTTYEIVTKILDRS